MNKRTGLALIILTTILAACTAQAAPAHRRRHQQPPTATAQPSAMVEPTAVPTVTPTPLSPDAQALKDIVFRTASRWRRACRRGLTFRGIYWLCKMEQYMSMTWKMALR